MQGLEIARSRDQIQQWRSTGSVETMLELVELVFLRLSSAAFLKTAFLVQEATWSTTLLAQLPNGNCLAMIKRPTSMRASSKTGKHLTRQTFHLKTTQNC